MMDKDRQEGLSYCLGYARDYTLQQLRRNERIGRGFTRMHADQQLEARDPISLTSS